MKKKTIEVDPILLALVLMTEDRAARNIAVTLNLCGFLVSGTICSRDDYMIEAEAYAAGRAGFNTSGALQTLHEFIRQNSPYGVTENEGGEKNIIDISETASEGHGDFIHLKNAQFLSSAFFLADEEGLPWRGKMSAVAAFTLGKLQVNRPSY